MDIVEEEGNFEPVDCDLPLDEFHTTSMRYLGMMMAALLVFLWILIDRTWYRIWTSRRSYRERVLYGARQRKGGKKLE